ncbi:hypothetical protein P3H15_31770 [Rhodococcus sp. T2V]|uniref:hypothetical protein n=1 Tax=Rhodococcus sp. T2V TaxID=3034164 RepID=UPI0023E0DE93|nr:hypothetical protein [Rhodococcus sp. T2V]MDF3309599.1 hypothetical protein [Rhodococcus sp. T2V]
MRVLGGAVGVLFLIMAISFLVSEPIWLPAALLFAISWMLLYFSAVAPLLTRRKAALTSPQPGDRVGGVLMKIAIGVAAPFAFVVATGAVDTTVHFDELAAYGSETRTSMSAVPAPASPASQPEAAAAPTAPPDLLGVDGPSTRRIEGRPGRPVQRPVRRRHQRPGPDQ